MSQSKRFIKISGILALCLFVLASPALRGQQKQDEEYTKKILEYTSEKFFLTELVDHLPASETVPTARPASVSVCSAASAAPLRSGTGTVSTPRLTTYYWQSEPAATWTTPIDSGSPARSRTSSRKKR